MNEKKQIKMVQEDPFKLLHIKNPSKNVQIAAVTELPFVIKNIENPSKEVQLVAVRDHGSNLQYIKNPSREIQIEAIRNFPPAITCIEKPDKEMQVIVMNKDAKTIRYIKNPSEEFQLLAIRKDPLLIDQIKNPTKKVCLESFSLIFNMGNMKTPLITEGQLFSAMKRGEKEIFFSLLTEHRTELQTVLYFENLLHFLFVYLEEWTTDYIKRLSPLTKEQQKIWKKYRLKTLV